MEAWLTSKTAGRGRTSPAAAQGTRRWPEEVFNADKILISSDIVGGLRRTQIYDIPSLAAKIAARVPALVQSMSDTEKRDAIKAAMPNSYLGALLDELVP